MVKRHNRNDDLRLMNVWSVEWRMTKDGGRKENLTHHKLTLHSHYCFAES